MEKMEFTGHAINDRIDRLVEIAMKCGLGTIQTIVPNFQKQSETCLTDTGVIIIRGFNGKIITAYVGTYKQVFAICGGRIPKALQKVVRNNEKRGYTKMK